MLSALQPRKSGVLCVDSSENQLEDFGDSPKGCDFMLERKSPFVCSVNGAKEISIENYGSLGDFSDKKIVLNCYKCKMIIEGEGLLIEYFTDVDMKITGHIHSIHF